MTRVVLFIAVLATMLVGCGSDHMVLYVSSTPTSNNKRPFYVVVRGVESETFLKESYKEVAAKMTHDPENSVLAKQQIYPGTEQEIPVYIPEDYKLPIAVYFLLTEPGSRWKEFFPIPWPDSVEFELDGNRVDRK